MSGSLELLVSTFQHVPHVTIRFFFFGGHPGPEYGFQRSRETRFYCSVQGMYLCLHVSSQGRWDNYSLPAKYDSILNGELITYAIVGSEDFKYSGAICWLSAKNNFLQ